MEKQVLIQNKCIGNRWVIGDVHGCSKTLKNLVEEKIQLTKDDQLFLLGDLIDKGPDSAGVIDYVLDLKEQGYFVLSVRGNHEQNLLDAFQEYDQKTFQFFVKRINKAGNLLDAKGCLLYEYLEYIKDMPYHIELDIAHLIHAGFSITSESPLIDYTAILESRHPKDVTEEYERFVPNKYVIHGHVPTTIQEIENSISHQAKILPLDNGCVYFGKKHKVLPIEQLGALCALNIDTFQLMKQINIDN